MNQWPSDWTSIVKILLSAGPVSLLESDWRWAKRTWRHQCSRRRSGSVQQILLPQVLGLSARETTVRNERRHVPMQACESRCSRRLCRVLQASGATRILLMDSGAAVNLILLNQSWLAQREETRSMATNWSHLAASRSTDVSAEGMRRRGRR